MDYLEKINQYYVQIITVKNDSYLDIPVYIGRPLTVYATGMLIRNPDCFDTDKTASIKKGDNPLDFPNFHLPELPNSLKN